MTQICKHTWQRLGSGFTGWMTHLTSDFHCYKEPVPRMGYYSRLLTWGILKSKVSRESISPPLRCSFCGTAKESRPFWWGCLESSGQLLPAQSWASPTSTAAASSVLKSCSPTWPQHPVTYLRSTHILPENSISLHSTINRRKIHRERECQEKDWAKDNLNKK